MTMARQSESLVVINGENLELRTIVTFLFSVSFFRLCCFRYDVPKNFKCEHDHRRCTDVVLKFVHDHRRLPVLHMTFAAFHTKLG